MVSIHDASKKINPPAGGSAGERPLQLDLFHQHLPSRPYCTDSLQAGLIIRSKQDAISKLYIQPNGPTHLYWLVYDVDRETSAYDWDDLHCPAPNIIATNHSNGHSHLFYGLEVPVRKDTPDAHLKPLKYAAAVEYALLKKIGGDYGYAGLIAKNPLRNDHWFVQVLQESPYTLSWLADYVDLEKIDYRKKPEDYGLGRNVTLFNRLRFWAYKAIRQHWDNYEVWFDTCLSQAQSFNVFYEPLPHTEIKATAKSVAKWTWAYFSPAQFSAIQSARGKLSGKSRKLAQMKKLELIKGLELYPADVVSKITGLSKKTVYYLRSLLKNL